MLARRTLGSTVSTSWADCESREIILLFWVVRRICEYTRIESPFDPIPAEYDDAMIPCLDEFVVEHDLYLLVKKFTAAMRKKGSIRTFAAYRLGRKILELIWQLLTRH